MVDWSRAGRLVQPGEVGHPYGWRDPRRYRHENRPARPPSLGSSDSGSVFNGHRALALVNGTQLVERHEESSPSEPALRDDQDSRRSRAIRDNFVHDAHDPARVDDLVVADPAPFPRGLAIHCTDWTPTPRLPPARDSNQQ